MGLSPDGPGPWDLFFAMVGRGAIREHRSSCGCAYRSVRLGGE